LAVWRRPSPLPGFGLAMGVTLAYLALVVLIPLSALVIRASGLGAAKIAAIALDARVLAALRVTFGVAFAAAAIDVLFGLLIAWVLTRYRFPGRRFFDALVDLPFALPTAVAGISLATLYAPNGVFGAALARIGVRVAFTPWGILVALIFVGLPFVVRTVQPIIEELERELEEASATLGASRLQTLRRVALPQIAPAFARGVGEYGSVIFIAGNIAYVSEIAPLLIIVKLEEYDYDGATAIAAIMLAVSFAMLFVINATQSWSRRRLGLV
jgi:sulfate transport system permease protein